MLNDRKVARYREAVHFIFIREYFTFITLMFFRSAPFTCGGLFSVFVRIFLFGLRTRILRPLSSSSVYTGITLWYSVSGCGIIYHFRFGLIIYVNINIL
jgi:hypothetical protein